MCGRFVQSAPVDDYARYFGADVVKTESLEPNYNVAPTDRVYAIAEHEETRIVGRFGWGLVPHWSKNRKQAARFINARAETLLDKPAFRDSFRTKRCLIPADGFYEWARACASVAQCHCQCNQGRAHVISRLRAPPGQKDPQEAQAERQV